MFEPFCELDLLDVEVVRAAVRPDIGFGGIHTLVPCARSNLGADFSVEDVRAYLTTFDWDAFDANRCDLARKFAGFLAANGLTPSKHLCAFFAQ